MAIVGPPESARPAALVREACRVATHAVVAVAPLSAFDGATGGELAPAGWTGREADGPGDVTVALARWATEDPALAAQVGVGTLEHRERWLALFAARAPSAPAPAACGSGSATPRPPPPAQVLHDPARVRPWVPVAVAPTPPKRSLRERLRGRAEREGRLLRERLRILRTRPSASER